MLYSELPTASQLAGFNQKLKDNSDVRKIATILSNAKGTHPMAQLAAATVVLSGVYKDDSKLTDEKLHQYFSKISSNCCHDYR